MEYRKVYVEVLGRFAAGGGVSPLELIWADGRRYKIERVVSVSCAPAHVSAVLPVRYRCLIGGKPKDIFYEPQRSAWFVEVAE